MFFVYCQGFCQCDEVGFGVVGIDFVFFLGFVCDDYDSYVGFFYKVVYSVVGGIDVFILDFVDDVWWFFWLG